METFPSLTTELRALLQQHFQVVAIHSQRQDQWYKRSYQAFTSEHGDRKPLIVVPRDSKEEWVPHVRRFATLLGSEIEATSKDRIVLSQSSSSSKLLPDSVLDKALQSPLCRAVSGSRPLSPDMMQISWWTSKEQKAGHKSDRLKGIKTLIACGEIDPLLHLAAWPGTESQASQWKSLNSGWETVVDDILAIFLFLGLMDAFPEDFVARYWVPVAFWTYNSPFPSYIEALKDKVQAKPGTVQEQIRQCAEALVAAQAWSVRGGFTSINWEDVIMDRFLYIMGFEAWNRSREGAGYLGCDLNVTKDVKFIRRVAQENQHDQDMSTAVNQSRKDMKPRDPLKLREAKREVVPELSEEEQREQEMLADLESQETHYGRKRSAKYLTRHKD
ncbi:hypothetical protein F66182_1089 [Fusarium sp. NRRL 66182]|nr:hypothetical protein F66182_1089 [Fusarium sp. NRRL 66182]